MIVVEPDLRDAATGEVLGQFLSSNGSSLWIDSQLTQGAAIGYAGFLGRSYDDSQSGVGRVEMLGSCGVVSWSRSSTELEFEVDIVGLHEIAFVTGVPRVSNDPIPVNHVIAIRSDGTSSEKTVDTIGRVVAAGADGTVYVRDCSPNASEPGNLIALGSDLVERWRLSVPGGCGNTNVLLADDGMLYFGRHASPGATEIVAVQTRSPGLARSAWPTWRHDNRATAWLTP